MLSQVPKSEAPGAPGVGRASGVGAKVRGAECRGGGCGRKRRILHAPVAQRRQRHGVGTGAGADGLDRRAEHNLRGQLVCLPDSAFTAADAGAAGAAEGLGSSGRIQVLRATWGTPRGRRGRRPEPLDFTAD